MGIKDILYAFISKWWWRRGFQTDAVREHWHQVHFIIPHIAALQVTKRNWCHILSHA